MDLAKQRHFKKERVTRKFIYLFTACLALAAAGAGYAWVTGTLPAVLSVDAQSTEPPANPHIILLAPEGKHDESLAELLATPNVQKVQSWEAAKIAAQQNPLDALLFDVESFDSRTDSDTDWLRSQLDEGVVIVGIGIQDDSLASALGIKTLLAPEEIARQRGDTGYRLVQAFLLAQPADLKLLKQSGWIDIQIAGSNSIPDGLEQPWTGSFSAAQGQLDTRTERELFAERLQSTIEDKYNTRSEFKEITK